MNTRLTRVAVYRGTICAVEESDYLVRKINGNVEPLVREAVAAQETLQGVAQEPIRRLHEKDFELLVDLIFAASGWRRVSVLGETEKDVDLPVEQIAPQERAFVQVKSSATPAVLADYVERFGACAGADRVVFACHSPPPRWRPPQRAPDRAVWLAHTRAQGGARWPVRLAGRAGALACTRSKLGTAPPTRPLALSAVARATATSELAVRDFLDSRHGRPPAPEGGSWRLVVLAPAAEPIEGGGRRLKRLRGGNWRRRRARADRARAGPRGRRDASIPQAATITCSRLPGGGGFWRLADSEQGHSPNSAIR